MKILLCEPGQYARECEIGDKLADMQAVVQGTIEAVYPFDDPVALIANDEGKINGMPLNRGLYGPDGELYDIVAGPFFVCGLGEENFADLTPELMQKHKERFNKPELAMRIEGEIISVKVKPYDAYFNQESAEKQPRKKEEQEHER